MSTVIIEALRKLKASGKDSFEDLVTQLISKLTGYNFYLAKSGYQGGRDSSSGRDNENVIALECKRYLETTTLDTRELLGELVQAKDEFKNLDAWILVTTRTVDSRLYESLYQTAQGFGIHFLCISNDGEPGELEILCSGYPDILFDFTKKTSELEARVKRIRSQIRFPESLEGLKNKVIDPRLGYPAWKRQNNSALLDLFSSSQKSTAHFGQLISIGDANQDYVERQELNSFLDGWYRNWQDSKAFCVINGEEGDGKTWGTARWILKRLEKDADFPGVFFVTSRDVTGYDPRKLITKSIVRILRKQYLDEEYWYSKLERWLSIEQTNSPLFLLVLDGINERDILRYWKNLLSHLNDPDLRSRIAVIITSRSSYWSKHSKSLSYFNPKVVEYNIPPFNHDELVKALQPLNLTPSEIPNEVIELISKPRYLSLAVKHKDKILSSGDITVERLIYEDWKDRASRKFSSQIGDFDFESFIQELAKSKIDKNIGKFSEADVRNFIHDHQDAFNELTTGGILRSKNRGRFEANEKFLRYGFGILLVNEIEDLGSLDEIQETIAQWLEPHKEMDIKCDVCHFAALIALSDEQINLNTKLSLLIFWLNSQNTTGNISNDFIAYLPLEAKAYCELAETVWSSETENPWAQELLMAAFLKHRDNPNVQGALFSKIEYWLGFIHVFGMPGQRRSKEHAAQISEAIKERIRRTLALEKFVFLGYVFKGIDDDGLLRLGRVALVLISYLPRLQFIRAIVTGVIAEVIMGTTNKSSIFQWVISSAPDEIDQSLLTEAEQILDSCAEIAPKVAYKLLSLSGDSNSIALRNQLPQELGNSPFKEEYLKDPCTSYFPWTEADCQKCMDRQDIPARTIASKIAYQCLNPDFRISSNLSNRLTPPLKEINISNLWSNYHTTKENSDFEDLEISLHVCSRDEISDFVRQAFRDIENRQEMSFRQLCFQISEHSLILENQEINYLYNAWRSNTLDMTDFSMRLAESYLFQFVLSSLNAEQQLSHLQDRDAQKHNLLSFTRYFKTLENVDLDSLLDMQTRNLELVSWFLLVALPEQKREKYIDYLFGLFENPKIRPILLHLLSDCGNQEQTNRFVQSSWSSVMNQNELELYFGNLILCKQVTPENYGEFNTRLSPIYLLNLLKSNVFFEWNFRSLFSGYQLFLICQKSGVVRTK